MQTFTKAIPLSLYIHIPWCIKKCPYCDFNSHRADKEIPESLYITRLIEDLEADLPKVWGRGLTSIFIGGGTPSLFSAHAIDTLLQQIKARIRCSPDMEVTLEANPGTFEQEKFQGYREAGVNRLSIGIQSFQADKLKRLGRVHNDNEAMHAVEVAKKAGFDNINLDLMHGLPEQTEEDALFDLTTAINFSPTHLSWYQLTLEPDTVFAKHPPTLPVEEKLWAIQQSGQALLAKNGFHQYEVSAYAAPDHQCQHNLNYWEFGDYLGIGAGAHSKITDVNQANITRLVKTRLPKDYLNKNMSLISTETLINAEKVPFEFMLNALRLNAGVPITLFAERTGLPIEQIQKTLSLAKEKGLLCNDKNQIKTTELGQRFLNDCLALFL